MILLDVLIVKYVTLPFPSLLSLQVKGKAWFGLQTSLRELIKNWTITKVAVDSILEDEPEAESESRMQCTLE